MGSGEVETYYENGEWRNRRSDTGQVFASGPSRQQMIATGAEVARWTQARHVIRETDGSIAEINVYGAGPYPHRSPVSRIRNPSDPVT